MCWAILPNPFFWAPFSPGQPIASKSGAIVRLQNSALKCEIGTKPLTISSLKDLWNGKSYSLGWELFTIELRNGTRIPASTMKLAKMVVQNKGGISKFEADLQSGAISVRWTCSLTQNSHYLRQELTISSSAVADVAQITLLSGALPGAEVAGSVPGSPIVADTLFVGVEYPMSVSQAAQGGFSASIIRKRSLSASQSATYSSVIGIAPAGQMRRAFAAYIESVRARPYRPFLHYNSWYDIGYFTKYDEQQCVGRIRTFGEELVRKRGVQIDSFLFDDGWDDTQSTWRFHKGFPRKFVSLKEAAAEYGAAPGIWLSPWGGYGTPREQRLAAGKKSGYEVDAEGFALSGPKYYSRFREVCVDLVRNQGINQFKFDGTGSPDKQYPGSAFDSDFDAAISLISDLRKIRKTLFVNLSTGTWPSPFWLRYVDSVWRGGADHDFEGVGTPRQRWITYRDAQTFEGVVKRGALYPLNSLMLHGIIFARYARDLNSDPGDDFANEVWSYFATGTQLQEMYITPSLLSTKNWDDLAAAARWARGNANTLRDTHWIGGDPRELDVYGWAAFDGVTGIIALRNPSEKTQAFSVDIAAVLQLPTSIRGTFSMKTVRGAVEVNAEFPVGRSKVVMLKPFEVRILQGSAEVKQ